MRYLIGSLSVLVLFLSSAQAQQFKRIFRNIECESETPFELSFPAGMDLSRVNLTNQASIRSTFEGENYTGNPIQASTQAHIWITVDLGGGLGLSLAPGYFTTDFMNATQGEFSELFSKRFTQISQAGGLDQVVQTGVDYPAILHVDCSSTSQGSNVLISISTFVQAVLIKIDEAR